MYGVSCEAPAVLPSGAVGFIVLGFMMASGLSLLQFAPSEVDGIERGGRGRFPPGTPPGTQWSCFRPRVVDLLLLVNCTREQVIGPSQPQCFHL